MKRFFSVLLIAVFMLLTFSAFAYARTGTVYVSQKGGTLHLRESESTSSKSLGFVKHGDKISILGNYGEWSYIYSSALDSYGYIKTKYIIEDEPARHLNVFFDTAYDLPATFNLDINGDTLKDSVEVSVSYDEYDTELYTLSATLSTGATIKKQLDFIAHAKIFFTDFNCGERVYMVLSGDVMSSDYVCECVFVENNTFNNVFFADAAPFTKNIYFPGSAEGIENGKLILNPVIDTLGTRFYTSGFHMTNNVLCPEEGYIWKSNYELSSAETWEYVSLTSTADINCVLFERPSVLPAGSKIVITALDENACRAYFVSDLGLSGYLTYRQPVSDLEWGVTINGIHEENLFEFIPYAG